MRRTALRRTRAEAGFTLIELIVVIAVLGILAATALPRFVDITTKARIAKMKAGEAALKTGGSLFHAAWLAANSPPNASAGTSTVFMEGVAIGYTNGYPDVSSTPMGIVAASGGLADYQTSVAGSTLTLTPDTTHPNCKVTYTEAVSVVNAPVVDDTNLIDTNC